MVYASKKRARASSFNYAVNQGWSVPVKASKRAKTIMAVMPKARRKKSYGMEGPEVKFFDNEYLNTAYSATGVVIDMSTMAQGLTNLTRVGNKTHLISAAVNFVADNTSNTAILANHHRWSIVLDKEPEAAALASYNQIYTDNSDMAFRNTNYSDRFVVLAEGRVDTGHVSQGAATVTAAGPLSWSAHPFAKCDVNSKYIGTTATQASVGSNQLLFTIISHVSDAGCLYDLRTRVRYTDE